MSSGFGAFGKMPALGDFIRFGLPAGFVGAWDTWLQEALTALKAQFAGGWDERYLSAPIWRFSLPAGQVGDQGYSGVLMASVDRVGRQFPLTLAAPMPAAPAPVLHFANGALFSRLEEIALTALDDNYSRDALAEALAPLSPAVAEAGDLSGRVFRGKSAPEAAIAGQRVLDGFGNVAVWSTSLEGDHRMMLCSGLPDLSEMAALFDLGNRLWARQEAEA